MYVERCKPCRAKGLGWRGRGLAHARAFLAVEQQEVNPDLQLGHLDADKFRIIRKRMHELLRTVSRLRPRSPATRRRSWRSEERSESADQRCWNRWLTRNCSEPEVSISRMLHRFEGRRMISSTCLILS